MWLRGLERIATGASFAFGVFIVAEVVGMVLADIFIRQKEHDQAHERSHRELLEFLKGVEERRREDMERWREDSDRRERTLLAMLDKVLNDKNSNGQSDDS